MSERTSSEIQRDIERTRAEMSHTIDALQERLSPGQLVDQAIWHLRQGELATSANDFAANLGRTIRDNPVPVVLIGTGLIWLLIASGRRGHGRYEGGYARYGYEPEDYYTEEEWIAEYGSTDEAAARYDERMRRHQGGTRRETDPAQARHYGAAPGPYGEPSSTPRPTDPTAERPGLSGSTVGAAAVNPGGPGNGDSSKGDAQSATERARQAAQQARERAAHVAGGPEFAAHTAGPATGSGQREAEAGRDETGDWRHRAGESAQHGMHEAGRRFEHASESARHGMERAGEYTREQTRRMREQARRGTRRAGSAFSRLLHERPLLMGAIGLAVGAAIGALIPATRRENEWLGEAADEVRHRAREEAQRARRIAERAVEAAREEAERQGLTPEGVKDELRQAERTAEQRARTAGHSATEQLKETGRQATESVKQMAKDAVHEARHAVEEKIDEKKEGLRKVAEAATEAAKEEAQRSSKEGERGSSS